MKFISPILFLGLYISFPAASAQLISKVVGIAGGQYVTSREVQINNLIEQALFDLKPSKVSGDNESQLLAEVNSVLLERVVSLEANQFAVAAVSDEALSQAQKKINKSLSARSNWKALKVSADEIKKQLITKLTAKQFIRFKVDSSYVAVTDAEAEEFFRKNSKLFQAADFKVKKDEIKASLSRQRVDQRLQDWFGILQKKYAVRNFITPS